MKPLATRRKFVELHQRMPGQELVSLRTRLGKGRLNRLDPEVLASVRQQPWPPQDLRADRHGASRVRRREVAARIVQLTVERTGYIFQPHQGRGSPSQLQRELERGIEVAAGQPHASQHENTQ